MERKLVVIDLDETLLRTDKSYDRERFSFIKDYLNREESILCIATGNSYHKIPDYFSTEERHNIYFACDNGNYILHNNQLVRKQGIPLDTLASIVSFVDEFEGFYPVVSTGEKSYFRHGVGPAFDHVVKYNNNLDIIDSFAEIPQDDFAMKIAFYSPESLERNKTLCRIISERYEDVEAVTSGDQWLDLYIKGGGKGSAVAFLQSKYQLDYDNSIVFGDSLNDESMMAFAKFAVAMGNSDPDLLHSASYKIPTNNEDAVINILSEYITVGNFDFMDKYYLYK